MRRTDCSACGTRRGEKINTIPQWRIRRGCIRDGARMACIGSKVRSRRLSWRMEILDENQRPIPGFTLEECQALTRDSVSLSVK